MKTLWKAFKKDLKSNNGNVKWEIGKWNHHKGELKMCHSGFHASERVIDAMLYTNLKELALVEVKGEHLEQNDKQCWQSMRIIKLYEWAKKDSVSLAVYAAELVLNYEKKYPNDKRPRNAIEAAKAVLRDDNEKTRSAAGSAARSVARSASWSADSAAWSAWSAEIAAMSARSAALSAAWSAAEESIINKCESFIQKRIKNLKEITDIADRRKI